MDSMPAAAVSTGPVPIEDLLAERGWVRALARSLVRDDSRADDLVQRAYVRAIERPPTSNRSVRGWFATVLRNLARDERRRLRRRDVRESAVARREAMPATADLVARAEAHRRLIEHVLRLGEPFRSVVLMRFFEGLSPAEIAARTGVLPGTVRTRLHRGLAELRARLGDDEARAWRAALMPLAFADGGATNAATSVAGGVVVGAKTKAGLAAAALLLCAAAVVVAGSPGEWLDGGERKSGVDAAAATVGGGDDVERARVPTKNVTDDAVADGTERAGANETATPSARDLSAPGGVRVLPLSARVVRHLPPREVPPGRTEIQSMKDIPEIKYDPDAPGGVGPRMLPYWTRWPSPPDVGTVTLRGEVRDATGTPLAGAAVMRIEPDESGSRSSPCSYQFIEEIAVTDARGQFEATGQPAGTWLVAADYHGMMNRPGGLDVQQAVPVSAAEQQTVSDVVVRLAIESLRVSSVEGTLYDENGEPVRGEVWVGRLRREWVGRDGRFAFAALQPGTHRLTFSSTGYARQTLELALVPGGTETLEVRLEPAEPGDLAVTGTVVDRQGTAVANARVFFAGSRHGSRNGRTDDEGVFRFDNLSRRYEKEAFSVMVVPHPDKDLYVGGQRRDVTLPADDLVLTVDRLARMTLTVVDRETGEPVKPLVVEARWEHVVDGETKQRAVGSAWTWSEDGRVDVRAGLGRNLVTVRGKGYRGVLAEVQVDDLTLPIEARVEMERGE